MTKSAPQSKPSEDWSYAYARCPQQDNGYDCGVHACMHVLCLAVGLPVSYGASKMDDFRVYIFNSLLEGELIQTVL